MPWLDCLLPEELDPLEDSVPLEDVLVDVSEPVEGVLELVAVSLLLELDDDPVPDDSVVEPLWLAAVAFAAARFSVVFPVDPVDAWEVGVVVAFFVESAGSCPEASCT